jgi:hypothetical protein
MFVRYRQTQSRLQASLVETRRINGKVRHERIASFGSVGLPPSVEDRIAFWQRLHQRLANLSNRLDAAAQAKVLGDIHARIPMVTPDEQQALKLKNARADERFWSNLHGMHAGMVDDRKGLAATAERKIAEGLDEMAKAAAQRDAVKERRERLERGEDVPGGFGKHVTHDNLVAILLDAGWSKSDMRRSVQVHRLSEVGAFEELMEEMHKRREQSEKAAVRAVWRRRVAD